MRRWIGWTAAVAVVVALWVVIMFAPHLGQWVALVWAVGLLTGGLITFIRARRRGTGVAETLRPDGPELITLQDDLLGRRHTAGAAWSDDRPVASLVVEPHPEAGSIPDRRPDATP